MSCLKAPIALVLFADVRNSIIRGQHNMFGILQSGCSLALSFTVNHYDRLYINSDSGLE